MEGQGIRPLRQPHMRDNRPAVISRRMMIVGLYMGGQGIHEISRRMGINRKTVQKWVRRYQEEGHVKTRRRCGRPRVTSPDDDRRVVEAAERNPLQTAVALTQDEGMPSSVVTTRRRLKEAELQCHVPARKERLSQVNRMHRLRFANQFVHEPVEFWRSVIFTDEKSFSSVSADIRHCWRRIGTRYEPQNIQEQSRSGRVTVSFHGWMWHGGMGELVPIDGHLTGQQYINILETSFLPAVRMYAIPEPLPIWLVQDRSPIHTSHIVRDWFSTHPEIQLIDWPSKGADLNPIENLWAVMMKGWEVEEKTRACVERRATERWEEMRGQPDICSSLTDSLPRRLHKVIEAQGGWTKY